MNFQELKQNTKLTIRDSKPRISTFTLIFLLIAVVLSFLMSEVVTSGANITDSTLDQYYSYYAAGEYEKAMDLASSLRISTDAYLISLAIIIVKSILGAGYKIFAVKTVRKNEQACFGNLLDGFGIAIKWLIMRLIKILLITLGFMLMVFPGFFLLYCYRQSELLLIDNPDWGPIKCLTESRKIMKGRKTELFRLDMSIILWYIFGFIGNMSVLFAFINLAVKPFVTCLQIMYYDSIRTENPETAVV